MVSSIYFLISTLIFAHGAAGTDPRVLHPLPRRWWDGHEHQLPSWFHRDGNSHVDYKDEKDCHKNETNSQADFELQGDEQLLWGSPNGTDAIVASVIIVPYPGQRIIDMGRFSNSIVRSTCSDNNILLQFDSVESFTRAKTSWDWVNEDAQKVFILVADPHLCNSGLDRDPWQVTHAIFTTATRDIRLDATKKRWADVIYDYKIDFGAADAPAVQKRASVLDYGYDKAFEIPLTKTFGPDLFDFKQNDPVNNVLAVQFGVKCNDCGLFGRLKFVGRIEGNYVLGVSKFDIGLVPEGVHVALNLELLFGGKYKLGMYGLPDLKRTFAFPDIPLAWSWKIDGILELGPKVRLVTGFELDSIEGIAKLTTGLTATVPDNSVARLSLRSDDVFQVSGWVPTFETKPLELDAQISAIVQLYFQIVPAFDFVILKQRGLRAGLPISLPNIMVNITAGKDPNGFCPGNPSPYGVKIQTELGLKVAAVAVVERSAFGLTQLFGNTKNKVELVKPEVKDIIPLNKATLDKVIEKAEEVGTKLAARSIFPRDVDLQKGEIIIIDKEVPNLPKHKFDPWCRALPGQNCLPFTPELEDKEWYDSEVASGIDDDSESLEKRALLSPRARDRSKSFECNKFVTEYKPKNYPGPTRWKRRFLEGRDSRISIANPGITRCQDSCPMKNWTVTSLARPNVVEIDAVTGQTDWSADHVYEVGWLAKFWQDLAEKRGLICPDADKNIDDEVLQIGVKDKYADKMLTAVGNLKTYLDMMILFPIDLNSLKYRMFAEKELYKDSLENNQDATQRACSIGRIVTTCKYMAMSQTQSRLRNTLQALDQVFGEMDANCTIPHPQAPLGSYVSAHREWFTSLNKQGITRTRETLVKYALLMQQPKTPNQDKVDSTTMETIIKISKLDPKAADSIWDEFCPNPFKEYPPSILKVALMSDVANCGYCGHKCPAGNKCVAGECIPPNSPSSDTFPPTVTPVPGPISQWNVYFVDAPFINTGSYILPRKELVSVDGKLTLNSKCLLVSEIAGTQGPTLPTNALFEWSRSFAGVEDYCCLAVFPGTSCTPGERKEFCDSKWYRMPFDAQSFLVFGCRSLKVD